MDDEYFSDSEEEEQEDEDEHNDKEHRDLVRMRACKKHLPEVQDTLKKLYGNLKPNIVTDRAELLCAVCPTTQRFKGWKALLAHADTFKKKRIQQHRGYGDAIKDALRAHGTSSSHSQVPSVTRTAALTDEREHLIVWPPVVVVETADRRSDCDQMILHVQRDLIQEFQDLSEEAMPRIVPIGGRTALLVFRSETVGYFLAKMVSERLIERRTGPILKSYLATPDNMKSIDPKRSLVAWTEQSFYLKVQQAQRKEKEEHDYERARLKEMELTVENLADDELKFKESKKRFEMLIDSKQKEVGSLKRKAEELEKLHVDKMRRLKADCQHEMKMSEAISKAKLGRLREQLEENERRMEEERVKRMKEIESLQLQFQAVTKDIKQKEAQIAVERELEVMRKKERFMADLARAETSFNEDMRKQESILQEQQHREQMQLMDEAKRERELVLQEWLAKQEKEKNLKEEPKEEEAECCLCMDALTEANRAFFKPCGHARICLECAIEVYKKHGSCPVCRGEIGRKPALLGRVYM